MNSELRTPNSKRGAFIVLYGINNLGKTTQAKLLVEKIKQAGHQAEYLKYPLYDLEPTGPQINAYLRQGNPQNLTPQDVQTLYAQNRRDYQTQLQVKLDQGINIIAEDYTGTGLGWGIGASVAEDYMRSINADLIKEDMAFLFLGKRFKEATENDHKHETNEDLLGKVDAVHRRLSEEFGWIKINANLSIEEIHNKIWSTISPSLNS